MGARDPSEDSPSDRVTSSDPEDASATEDATATDDATAADDATATCDATGADDADGTIDAERSTGADRPDDAERVDVVWFPSDDDYVVVAAGNGDRAVNFHRYGRVGVAAVGALFAMLGVLVLHEYVTATTDLAWPTSGVAFATGALAVAAYAHWRYDPDPPPEVVARDEPAGSAREEFDFEQ
jgi:hypothetical protein